MTFRLLILSIIQSFLLASGQVTLKLAMMKTPHFTFTWHVIKQYLFNYWFILTGILFGGATVLWFYILKHYPLSDAYPLTSIAYIFGLIAGIAFLNESSSVHKWIGVLLIVVGAFLLIKK